MMNKKLRIFLSLLFLAGVLSAGYFLGYQQSINGNEKKTAAPANDNPSSEKPKDDIITVKPGSSEVVFMSAISRVSERQKAEMLKAGSWKQGCPVSVSKLRVVSVTYWGFDDKAHQGQLMVHSDAANSIVKAFHALYEAKFPVNKMELVEKYAADDEKSMQDDNTSAFNCRRIPGSTAWSQHSYGRAVDINPLENPEIRNGKVDPTTATHFVDRSQKVKGMIHAKDAAVKAFESVGWHWGGYWDTPKDYQHFSESDT